MEAFIDRSFELAFLKRMQESPGAGLVLLYGRRRIGKTALLRHWAESSGLAHVYWAAEKEPAVLQRRKLFAKLFSGRGPETRFESWGDCFAAMADVIGNRRQILILDELPYAEESDPSVLSALQHAWDQHFKASRTLLVLCGSHVNMMERLLNRQSPLYGRFSGQWHLQALPFGALKQFGTTWSADERVAFYATLGGVPAYLEWLQPHLSYSENLREVLLAPGSMFVAEPEFLLYDEVREPRNYLAILRAIGGGAHTLAEIQRETTLDKSAVTVYLARLQELYLVERRIPVTLAPQDRHSSRMGRYHLSDPYFRFYFRFLAPRMADVTYSPDRVIPGIRDQLRAFIGMSAWELLCQHWVRFAGNNGELNFAPEDVGAHWGPSVQVDVVGVSWALKHLLLGECKWQPEPVGQQVLRELVEVKAPRLLIELEKKGRKDWQLSFAAFARGGFTESAVQYALTRQIKLIDLDRLDQDLGSLT